MLSRVFDDVIINETIRIHFAFLFSFFSNMKSFKSLNDTFENSANFVINEHFAFDELKKSVSDLRNRVEELCNETFNSVSSHGKMI